MESNTQVAPTPKWMFWVGWVLSVLPALLLFMSAYAKLSQSSQAVEGMAKFGYPADILVPLGVVELACTILYLVPRTAVLGAILLTGYLGGATATHVRAGDPASAFLTPVVVGVLVWLGLYLRDARVRALVPLRS